MIFKISGLFILVYVVKVNFGLGFLFIEGMFEFLTIIPSNTNDLDFVDKLNSVDCTN